MGARERWDALAACWEAQPSKGCLKVRPIQVSCVGYLECRQQQVELLLPKLPCLGRVRLGLTS